MFDFDQEKNTKLYTFLNPYSYLIARRKESLFRNFTIYIDGILFVYVLRLFGFSHVTRKSFDMTSLAPQVFNRCIENNLSVYIIGSRDNEIRQAIVNLRGCFPDLNIVGYRDGYFDLQTRNEIIQEIVHLSPDVTIAGMGTPVQEEFLYDLKRNGWGGEGYTCGGFIHQTATKLHYYPKWIDELNLRWIYRVYREPYLLKRYLFEYPKFLVVFLFDYLFDIVNARL